MIHKKSLAKVKKDVRERKKAEAKEKKKAEAEAAKTKKRAEAEVVKEKKRVEAEAIAWKKIKDRAVKHVETSLQKEKTNKCKVALSSDSVAKKKQRKMEDITEMESKPNLKAKTESENSNMVWKFEFIKL